MIWALLAGFVSLIAVLTLGGRLGRVDRAVLKRIGLWSLVVLAAVAAVLLAVTGKWPAVAAVAAAALPVVMRLARTALGLVPVWHLFRRARPQGGAGLGTAGTARSRPRTIETRSLRMTLDTDTGAMSGVVLDGPERGQGLEELSVETLIALLRRLRVEDPDGARLLENWGERTYGPGWSDPSAGSGGAGTDPAGADEMSEAEARAILGVEAGAGAAEITAAWRRMMARVHPDHGGSAALAARVNAARDRLLGARSRA
ncbi:molecular chaperone DnaJ [Tistrella mobilis]|uniref:molecular chaperone DnaJ n=1 Tax=Tistrella mobilis TaxID=171437 RepID=UPI0035560904